MEKCLANVFENYKVPKAGFLAWNASSVVNNVWGKRMKIFDLPKKKMSQQKQSFPTEVPLTLKDFSNFWLIWIWKLIFFNINGTNTLHVHQFWKKKRQTKEALDCLKWPQDSKSLTSLST